ncbi:glycerophosphodiester phosphodiesterase family protein [Agrococcus casei]|uniref:glycerophosphodiester phosphodiesterase family protein n=1 Tax=Agrococcus casei TaxID=343512 RepID=UPI003F8DCE7A
MSDASAPLQPEPVQAARRSPRIIAHRGASGYRPEHSRAAYELAIEQGADAVEPDLVLSLDGELVIRHENDISDTTDVAAHPEFAHLRTTKTVDGTQHTGWFTEDFTWEQLQTLRLRERLPELRPSNAAFDDEPMLRLEDLLELLEPTGVDLVAEIKSPGHFADCGFDIGRVFAERMRAAGWADRPDRVWVESFEEPVLHTVRDGGVQGPLVYAVGSYGAEVEPGQLRQLADRGVDGLSVEKSMLLADGGQALIESAGECGLDTFVYSLRPENAFLDERYRSAGEPAEQGNWPAEWRVLAATGVGWVFADHPDFAVSALRD